MIYLFSPMYPTFYEAAEPPGGCHGTRRQAHRKAMERTGSVAVYDRVGGCLSQLPDHPQVRFAGYDSHDCPTSRMQSRNRQTHSQAVPHRRNQRPPADQAAGTQQSGHSRVHRRDEAGRADESTHLGLRILHLVGRSSGRPFGQGHGDSLQRRPDASVVASAGVFRSSSQAHAQGQARREGLPKGRKTARPLKKKP